MVRWLQIGMLIFGSLIVMPSLASAQKADTASATGEDPNDKAQYERSFDETRKHMQEHSEWSKKTGKMNDN